MAPPRGFDASLAERPERVRVLPIEDVVDLLDLTHAPERIAEYRATMERGQLFPPVAVVRLLGRHLVADGHKRLAAYRALGEPAVPVEVWTLRRWLRDQLGQGARALLRNGSLLLDLVRDRPRARRLVTDTVGHWRRVARSLARRLPQPLRSAP